MTDLAYLTVADGAQLLRAKKLSPVEWTLALLARIAAVAESVEPGAPSRRLVERLGRCACCRHGASRARHRHRRFGAQSRDLLRHHRTEADLRRGEPQWRVPADPFARPCRADDPHGR